MFTGLNQWDRHATIGLEEGGTSQYAGIVARHQAGSRCGEKLIWLDFRTLAHRVVAARFGRTGANRSRRYPPG